MQAQNASKQSTLLIRKSFTPSMGALQSAGRGDVHIQIQATHIDFLEVRLSRPSLAITLQTSAQAIAPGIV
eukprot:1161035-Pelagomonas_calceolata.AAC.6